MFQSSKKVIVFVVLVVVLVGLGVGLGMFLFSSSSAANSPYSAVYLSTGDIYFGKLSWFPKPHLTNVWYLQRSADQNNQPQVALAQFKKVVWEPSDEIYLNEKSIVFWTHLPAGSKIVQAMENPTEANPPAGGPSQQPSQSPSPKPKQ